MHPQRRIFAALQLVGGPLVLGSYGYGLLRWPETAAAMWGGVPEAMRQSYIFFMFAAAAGYLALTQLFFFHAHPSRARVLGRGYWLLHLAYALVLFPSALWMPLTKMLLDAPSPGLWLAVRLDLAAVALGSLLLAGAAATLRPGLQPMQRRLALLGATAFCLQTVVLDALIWPALFPAPQ
ncbi:MAG: hypothetical protein OXU78_04335 [Deltaproteobacteria bacterium]|nr:hypothetical protein [Deltaproteobacteria bacterium]